MSANKKLIYNDLVGAFTTFPHMFKTTVHNMCDSRAIYHPHIILTNVLATYYCTGVCAEKNDMKHFGITIYKID